MDSQNLLRKLISEIIDSLNNSSALYPWKAEENNITLYKDFESGKYFVTVENNETGESFSNTLKDESEAWFWARQKSEELKRSKFSREK